MHEIRVAPRPADFSRHVSDLITKCDWPGLQSALVAGLPANLDTADQLTLWEAVCYAMETNDQVPDRTDVKPGPPSLLDAFVSAGLTKNKFPAGSTAVMLAVHYGQWDYAKKLIALGFSIDSDEHSCLHALIDGRSRRMLPSDDVDVPINIEGFHTGRRLRTDSHSEHQAVLDIVQLLAQSGSSLDVLRKDEMGETDLLPPIARAAWNMDVPVIFGLGQSGAQIDLRAPGSGTALELAIFRGDPHSVKALLKVGASLLPDANLEPALARQNQALVLAARYGKTHLLETIADHLTPAAFHEHGNRAMHLAASQDDPLTMKLLHIMGIPYDVKSVPSGFKPIHQASRSGSKKAIDFLLTVHQSLEDTSKSGLTAGSILQSHHPQLAKIYGVAPSTVHFLSRRAKGS